MFLYNQGTMQFIKLNIMRVMCGCGMGKGVIKSESHRSDVKCLVKMLDYRIDDGRTLRCNYFIKNFQSNSLTKQCHLQIWVQKSVVSFNEISIISETIKLNFISIFSYK